MLHPYTAAGQPRNLTFQVAFLTRRFFDLLAQVGEFAGQAGALLWQPFRQSQRRHKAGDKRCHGGDGYPHQSTQAPKPRSGAN